MSDLRCAKAGTVPIRRALVPKLQLGHLCSLTACCWGERVPKLELGNQRSRGRTAHGVGRHTECACYLAAGGAFGTRSMALGVWCDATSDTPESISM